MWPGIHERDDDEFRVSASVKMIEQNNMGKTLEVFQPIGKFGKDIDGSPSGFRAGWLNGHPFGGLEW
jgi:hypothetical protein